MAIATLTTGSMFVAGCDLFSLDDLNSGLTEAEVVEGLKEALNVGTDTAVAQGSSLNGFFLNPEIKIPFPEEVSIVKTVVESVPGGSLLVDEFVTQLNRAAEDAAEKATPIFKDAILNITFTDAFNILNGADTAATSYLRTNTFSALYDAFKPDIETSLTNVGAQGAWEAVVNVYNAVPFTDPVSADLADYTTNKGLKGLFVLVGNEEVKIRNDISHQVSDILQKVFGN
ncbi:MAG: DUF4197 domain-containing protein [Chitinophagales bacterium]|nr:DUF4197 domain-containing protein [Chitinophagales bacterium]HPE97012.1 DUF4197 domain-containing protein [Chitinophagales bacterium]HPR29287.1 DUF4197 domain-containing protein [Chitinophagales bacterium]HRX23070.1 DUF4197 domain-containing protein [Chitinophagales bacterium]